MDPKHCLKALSDQVRIVINVYISEKGLFFGFSTGDLRISTAGIHVGIDHFET